MVYRHIYYPSKATIRSTSVKRHFIDVSLKLHVFGHVFILFVIPRKNRSHYRNEIWKSWKPNCPADITNVMAWLNYCLSFSMTKELNVLMKNVSSFAKIFSVILPLLSFLPSAFVALFSIWEFDCGSMFSKSILRKHSISSEVLKKG